MVWLQQARAVEAEDYEEVLWQHRRGRQVIPGDLMRLLWIALDSRFE